VIHRPCDVLFQAAHSLALARAAGDPWTPKTWIVVPVDAFAGGSFEKAQKRIGFGPNQIRAYGEESQSLTTEQFTNRLIATLDYLRTNNRPHWQTVSKEHTVFLESLPR